MEDIDIFITDPTHVDLEVYDLWLKGLSGKVCRGLLRYLVAVQF